MMKRKDCELTRRSIALKGGRGGGRRLVPSFAAQVTGILLLTAAPAAAATVRLWPQSTIDRPEILLADVAGIEGFSAEVEAQLLETRLGPAPAPGGERAVTLADIRANLEARGVNMAMVSLRGAAVCRVRRAHATSGPAGRAGVNALIPEDPTLRGHIRRTLESRLPVAGGRLELTFARGAAELLKLSGPGFTFEVTPRNQRVLGSVDLEVAISGPQGMVTEHVAVMCVLRLPVVVAARPINRGQVIRAEDVRIEERAFEQPAIAAFTSLDPVIGQEGRRLLRPGEVLESDDLKAVPLVKRGELVGVLAATPGLTLEIAAKALEDGGLGDIIELRNEASRETFQARVKGLRQAEALPVQTAVRRGGAAKGAW